MNRLLSVAVLGAAVLCPAAQAAPALLTPVTYDPAAAVPDRVKEECRIDFQLESEISNALARRFKLPNSKTTSTDGETVRATITYVLGAAAGSWSGPKSITIQVELMNNGKVERSTKLHRTSMPFGFRGTCSILDRDARALGKDVVKWIENPSYGTSDDVLPPAAPDGTASPAAQ